MSNPFPDWLQEVAQDTIVVRGDDINVEARGNLWTFGLDSAQRAAVTVGDIEQFITAVAAARARSLATAGGHAMRFYCWHDVQAGQLRLSLVSTSHGRLPFASEIEVVSDLGIVLREFLGWEPSPGARALRVWATELP